MKMASDKRLAALSLAALGVVYGDIGTSPLYAFKVAMLAATRSGVAIDQAAIGVASLVFWSLIVVVSIKYALLILRANNRGEGGVMALLALLGVRDAPLASKRGILLGLGVLGAALLYGDGAITPSISVLSAVEGLTVEAPGLRETVIPVTLAILIALFLVQSRGTGFIGKIFGPVMLCWFLAIGLSGVGGILRNPGVIAALAPSDAIEFLVRAPLVGSFAVLGAVFLAVTGGEAMYADLGHFGPVAIRAAWFLVALPALTLNYLGQAALVIADRHAIANPFFGLASGWMHYPMVVFATLATVIASQAIISGVFSLTQQAIQLGFLPRLRILHTASDERGQIYIPLANSLLALATISAVLTFRSSDALAGAYGIAVSGLMAITTVLAGLVAINWGYHSSIIILVNGAFMAIDLIFFSANSLKLVDGGWFPLMIAAVIAFLMLTWHQGMRLLEARRAERRLEEQEFISALKHKEICRVPGIAIFLSASKTGIPLSLSTHVKHNKALQHRVFIVSVIGDEVPFINPDKRAVVSVLAPQFERVVLKYGFMETANIPQGLQVALIGMAPEELRDASYYIGHETIIPDSAITGMWQWREAVFMWMQRNSAPTGASFGIPSGQLVEVGTEISI